MPITTAERSVPGELQFLCDLGGVALEAAAGEGAGPKLPKFSMLAYTGGPIDQGWGAPVVVDLSGMKIPRQKIPIRLNHDAGAGVGHTERVWVDGASLKAEGVVSRATPQAAEVVTSGAAGFPWQASIGAKVVKATFVSDNDSATVNGKTYKGPLYVATKTTLGEISFVDLGADGNTAARIAAHEGANMAKEGDTMESKSEPVTATDAPQVVAGASVTAPVAGDAVADIRASAAAECKRIADIRAACGKNDEIAAKAIAEGWSKERAELEVLRAARPSAPAIHAGGDGAINATVIEAALRLGSSQSTTAVEKAYDAKTLEAAHKIRRIGVRGLIELACRLDGVAVPSLSDDYKTWVRAGFSTASLPGILGATANKSMLDAFSAVPSAARLVAKKLTANDFKTHTGYRLTGDNVMKKIAGGGELRHGTLGESSFTYSVDTYGEYLAITRQMFINDDLGAFMQIPSRIGRGAALALENAFWALVIANTGTFFGTANANYIEGSTTALSIAGLDAATQTLEEQVDADGNPILVTGKYLVVPPALSGEAKRLYVSDALVTGSTAARAPSANTYKGLYQPITCPYIKAAPAAWYLFADPNDIAAFGIAYLKGVESPVIEEVQPEGDTLGMAWRGYLDFGVCQIDKAGAVKSKGTA